MSSQAPALAATAADTTSEPATPEGASKLGADVEKAGGQADHDLASTEPAGKEDVISRDAVDDSEDSMERWNHPRMNIFRFWSTLFCFIVMGMNDASVGALLPYIGDYYNVSYIVVSLLFLSPFVGYFTAAMLNNLIHHKFGQLGIAILGPVCRLIAYIPLSLHPAYPALPVIMLFSGLGNGLEDSAWNAWVGNMHQANELLGFLHGAYGLGATIGPLIATAMVTKGNLPWYTFYYVMIGMTVFELLMCVTSFWGATGKVHRETHKSTTGQKRTTTRRVLREPITWLLAFFLLGYVGAEVSLGGWIVALMLEIRHAEPFLAGITVTLFWLGLTIGRVILGFVTGRIGEKLAITIYLVLSIALEVLYWLVPNFTASVVFVMLLGFFLGPLFPAAIIAAAKLLPLDYHVSAIGFAAAFGGGGASLFPFAVGAIAQSKGVAVLQPVVLAILVFIILIWLCVPGGMRKGGLERARAKKERVGDRVIQTYHWLSEKSRPSRHSRRD